MYRTEIHPAAGGTDAEGFAAELGSALAKYTNGTVTNEGRVTVVISKESV